MSLIFQNIIPYFFELYSFFFFLNIIPFSLVQSLSHVWLFCNPMVCSTPGFPVLHQLSELAQTDVPWVDDAIQPSHSLSSLSPPSLNSSKHQHHFQWVSSSHQVVKVLELQLASASVLSVNIQNWFPLGLTGWISLQSKRLSRVFSNTTVQKHQLFGSQLSLWSNSHFHTWLLEKPYPWLDRPLSTK